MNEINGKILLSLEEQETKELLRGTSYGIIKVLLEEIRSLRTQYQTSLLIKVCFFKTFYQNSSNAYIDKDAPLNVRDIVQSCPSIRVLLLSSDNPILEEAVTSIAIDSPFQDDQEYLSVLEASFLVQKHIFEVKKKIRSSVVNYADVADDDSYFCQVGKLADMNKSGIVIISTRN